MEGLRKISFAFVLVIIATPSAYNAPADPAQRNSKNSYMAELRQLAKNSSCSYPPDEIFKDSSVPWTADAEKTCAVPDPESPPTICGLVVVAVHSICGRPNKTASTAQDLLVTQESSGSVGGDKFCEELRRSILPSKLEPQDKKRAEEFTRMKEDGTSGCITTCVVSDSKAPFQATANSRINSLCILGLNAFQLMGKQGSTAKTEETRAGSAKADYADVAGSFVSAANSIISSPGAEASRTDEKTVSATSGLSPEVKEKTQASKVSTMEADGNIAGVPPVTGVMSGSAEFEEPNPEAAGVAGTSSDNGAGDADKTSTVLEGSSSVLGGAAAEESSSSPKVTPDKRGPTGAQKGSSTVMTAETNSTGASSVAVADESKAGSTAAQASSSVVQDKNGTDGDKDVPASVGSSSVKTPEGISEEGDAESPSVSSSSKKTNDVSEGNTENNLEDPTKDVNSGVGGGNVLPKPVQPGDSVDNKLGSYADLKKLSSSTGKGFASKPDDTLNADYDDSAVGSNNLDDTFDSSPPRPVAQSSLRIPEKQNSYTNVLSGESYDNESDSGFLRHALIFIVISGVCWVLFHNRKRVIAMVVEGRRPKTSRRRSSSGAGYRKLENNFD